MLQMLHIPAAIFLLAIFIGCRDKNPVSITDPKNNSDINNSISSNSSSSDFKIVSFHVARPYEGSQYLCGVAEIEYTGNQPLHFLKVYATLNSKSGSILFKDTTYLDNETTVAYKNSFYTNTFVSQENPRAYYLLIEKLSFSPMEIHQTIFEFEGDTFTPLSPVSQLLLSGTPYESNGSLNQNFTNNGPEEVNVRSCIFVFTNSSGISYDWTYPTAFRKQGVGYVESDIIGADSEGRLSSSIRKDIIDNNSLSIKKTLFNWEPAIIVLEKTVATIADPDAYNKSLRKIRDEQINKLHKKLYE